MEPEKDINTEKGSFELKVGLAEMLKGGVIMDVTTPEQAIIACATEQAVIAFDPHRDARDRIGWTGGQPQHGRGEQVLRATCAGAADGGRKGIAAQVLPIADLDGVGLVRVQNHIAPARGGALVKVVIEVVERTAGLVVNVQRHAGRVKDLYGRTIIRRGGQPEGAAIGSVQRGGVDDAKIFGVGAGRAAHGVGDTAFIKIGDIARPCASRRGTGCWRKCLTCAAAKVIVEGFEMPRALHRAIAVQQVVSGLSIDGIIAKATGQCIGPG